MIPHIKHNGGYYIIVVLAVIPLAIWSTLMPLPLRFSNFSNTMTSIGQITSLTGMALFALTMVLSIRCKLLEELFGGMNRGYRAHHIFGGISFILLLIHPLFLSFANAQTSMAAVASFLLPGEDWTVNFGIAALLLMMAFLILTFFVHIVYNLWRLTHRLLGIAFFLGSVHSFFVPSDISREPVLRYYMLVLIALGTIGYLYQIVLGRFIVKRYKYIVDEIDRVSDAVIELIMSPVDEALPYTPGQYVFISFCDPSISSETHPFSISSSPSSGEMRLTIKSLGDFTKMLTEVKPGMLVKLEGPYGKFSYLWKKNFLYLCPAAHDDGTEKKESQL